MLLRRFISLSTKLWGKYGVSTRFLYKALNPLWNGRLRLPSEAQASEILGRFSPDNCSSAIAPSSPLPDIKYDLAIIIGAYNMESYIGDCLDSILSQPTDYKTIVKVVDDGSTDNTYRILRRYSSDSRVRIFRHDTNLGVSAARNTALRDLDARYIACVDADDKLHPGSIDKVLRRAFLADADAVELAIERFTDDGNIIYSLRPHDSDDTSIRDIVSLPTIFFYKRELYRGIRFPVNLWYEDVIFELLFYPRLRRIISVDTPYYMYRMREGSITQSPEAHKQIDSLYGGISVLRDSVRLRLWDTPDNTRWLTDYFYHLIRITYLRTFRFPRDIRMSIFVSWREIFHELSAMLASPEAADATLQQALATGDYREYEFHCIHRGL